MSHLAQLIGEERMKITHKQAIEILKAHYCEPTDNAMYDGETNLDVPNTSFYAELGIKKEYSLRDVKTWLGY